MYREHEVNRLKQYLRDTGWSTNNMDEWYHSSTNRYRLYGFDAALKLQAQRDGIYNTLASS